MSLYKKIFSFSIIIFCIYYLKSFYVSSKKDYNQKNEGYIIVFSVPDYIPQIENSTLNNYFKTSKLRTLGHSGCILIFPNGYVYLYEFGKYENDNYGVVLKKHLGRIAILDKKKIINFLEIIYYSKNFIRNIKKEYQIDAVLLSVPNIEKSFEFAEIKKHKYCLIDVFQGGGMNCATFPIEVAINGGLNLKFPILAQPKDITDNLKKSNNFIDFVIVK